MQRVFFESLNEFIIFGKKPIHKRVPMYLDSAENPKRILFQFPNYKINSFSILFLF